MKDCEHLHTDDNADALTPDGCEECLATGDTWVHLRFCATCGQVGCCNDSKNKHAARHWASSGHPVVISGEQGEDWAWCFVDDVGLPLQPLGD